MSQADDARNVCLGKCFSPKHDVQDKLRAGVVDLAVLESDDLPLPVSV